MWWRRSDDRGAVLVISVVGVVIALLAAALAVDLGTLAAEKRSDQKVADLAALDAVRGLLLAVDKPATATLIATQSAVRNGYDPADSSKGHSLVVVLGQKDTTQPPPNRNFHPTCPPASGVPDCVNVNAVKVSVTSSTPFSFAGGAKTVTVSAVAFQDSALPPPPPTTTTVPPSPTTTVPPGPDTASFSLGSSLVNVDSSSSALLNPVIGKMLGGSGLSLSLVSWQGLAKGDVTLAALQTALAKMNVSVGTVSQLLSADLTAAQLYQATASALTAGGDTADANVLNVLKAAASVTAAVRLGDLVTVGAGTDPTDVLNTRLNLLQLVTGSAEVANGTSTVSVPNLGITVPSVASTDLTLKVTELPQIYIGPAGGSVTTGQVDLSVTTNLDLSVSLGLSLLHVAGPLPVGLQLAGAKGTLASITCSGTEGIGVTADPKAFSGAAQVTTLNVTTLLGIPVLNVQETSATPSIDGPASSLSFSYPSEFPPNDVSKHAGSQPIGLQSATTLTPGTVTVLSIPLGLTVSQIVTAVTNALHPVLGDVDNNVLTPLLTALGVDIGGADVTALGLNCATAPPPATTTTTVPPPTTSTTAPQPQPNGPPKLIG